MKNQSNTLFLALFSKTNIIMINHIAIEMMYGFIIIIIIFIIVMYLFVII